MKKLLTVLLLMSVAYSGYSQHWVVKNSGVTDGILYKVIFVNDSVGYAVGNNNTNNFVLKTTDAGEHWANMSTSVINKMVKGIYFSNKDTGFVVGKQGSIYKTVDGGTNWVSKNAGTTFDFNDICFIGLLDGFAIGKQGNFKLSPNAGNAWGNGNLVTTEDLSDILFVNDTLGFLFAANNGKAWKTINGGLNWDTLKTFPVKINDASFVNTNVGYVCGPNNYVRRTLNSGQTWTSMAPAGYSGKEFYSIFSLGNEGYVAGDSGLILYTTNGGGVWKKDTTSTNQKIYSLYFTNKDVGYAVGANGLIMKRVPKPTVGIKEANGLLDLSIYPNPIDNKAMVRFSSNVTGTFVVNITDLRGKFLGSKEYLTKDNSFEINLSGYEQGVYLLRIIHGKEQVCKMILKK